MSEIEKITIDMDVVESVEIDVLVERESALIYTKIVKVKKTTITFVSMEK